MPIQPLSAEFLKKVPLFDKTSDDDLFDIWTHSHRVKVPRGQPIFQSGQPADRFYVILSGWVRLFSRSPDGSDVVIFVIEKGQTFGDVACFGRKPYQLNAQADGPVELLEITYDFFAKKVHKSPDFALKVLAAESARYRGLVHQFEDLMAKSAPSRIATFLVRLVDQVEDDQTVQLPYDKSLIAAKLGMQPETFSRAFSQLKREKIIAAQGHVVRVLDDAALRRTAGVLREQATD